MSPFRPSKNLVMLVTFAGFLACSAPKDQPAAQAPAPLPEGIAQADVDFMSGMIGHHAQAIKMAAMAPTHGASEKLQFFAKKIDISQRSEIEMMENWLKDKKQPLPDSTMHHMMPGMLTPEQMTQLDAARGTEFERLFLTFMIQHHQGALTMVETLYAHPPAGQESEIFRFLTDVKNDQSAEIDAMTNMLNALPGGPNQ